MMNQQDAAQTWAVLVPAPAQEVERIAERAWVARFGEDEDDLERWETLRGAGAYSAILSRHPGSEGDDEELAVEVSKGIPGDVYVLRFRDGAEAVWVFAGGRLAREESPTPWATAERLGIKLRDTPPVTQPAVRSVCVVEGAPVDAVRRAVEDAVGTVPVRFAQTPSGTIVYTSSGDASMLCSDIAVALPESIVYAVMLGPQSERFGVIVLKGEEERGSFEANGPTMPGFEPLRSIKGETEPRRILRALGIPTELVPLSPGENAR